MAAEKVVEPAAAVVVAAVELKLCGCCYTSRVVPRRSCCNDFVGVGSLDRMEGICASFAHHQDSCNVRLDDDSYYYKPSFC